jgi:radical SAM superfamily enzyme YgiQ (UPF0313 family)
MSRIALVAMYDEFCLGIRYISSYLRQHGHTPHIFMLKSQDYLKQPWGQPDDGGYHLDPCNVSVCELDLLTSEIASYEPDLIGISLASNFLGLAERITEELRKRMTVPIAWGGIEPTVNPQDSIIHADYICQGEGERSVLELVESLARGGRGENIPGIWRREGDSIHSQRPRPLETDLDHFPFPDFIEKETTIIQDDQLYKGQYPADSRLIRHMAVISQRGCPFSCSYCCNSVLREILGRKNFLRRRSAESFIQEIEQRLADQPSLEIVEICDDVFTMNMKWIESFALQYKRRIGLPFVCDTYPNMCEPKMMSLLRDAGLFSATMGLQSGSERVLRDVYGRRTTSQEVIDAANVIKELGLNLVVDLIGYHPLENEDDLLATLNLLLRLPAPFTLHTINPMSFYKGFKITRIAQEMGAPLKLEPGTNKYSSGPIVDYDRWAALYYMTQYAEIPREAIAALAEARHANIDSAALLQLSQGIIDLGNNNGDIYQRKADRIAQLERELETKKGGRSLALRERLRRLAP